MKNILRFALVLVAALTIQVKTSSAQCPLTEAVDFTVTDLDGNTHTLFDILDNDGKYVLIDFFYTT